MGDSLGAILEECGSSGMALPATIQDHLEQREPWMDFYLGAYNDLATCRGPSHCVPWLAIDRYCQRFGFDDEFSIWFIRCIRAIDDAHLGVWKEQQAREKASMEAKARRR